jgi:hypothetical protein
LSVPLERLRAVASVPPVVVAVHILLIAGVAAERLEGFEQAGLDAIAAVVVLVLAGPLVVHATAQPARATRP